MATTERPPLTRASVVGAAIEVIDAGGLAACTMRAVATRLGVEPMSLYWHVANKDDLLDGVIAAFLEGVADPPADAEDWRAHIRRFAAAFRGLVLEHPQVALLLAQRPATAYISAKKAAVSLISGLEREGFATDRAVDIVRMVVRFVFGVAIAESAARSARPSRSVHDGPELDALLAALSSSDADRMFALSVDTLIAGIEEAVPRA